MKAGFLVGDTPLLAVGGIMQIMNSISNDKKDVLFVEGETGFGETSFISRLKKDLRMNGASICPLTTRDFIDWWMRGLMEKNKEIVQELVEYCKKYDTLIFDNTEYVIGNWKSATWKDIRKLAEEIAENTKVIFIGKKFHFLNYEKRS